MAMTRCDPKYNGDRNRNSLVQILIALTAVTCCLVSISAAAESDSSSTAVLYQPTEFLDGAAIKRRESVETEVGSLVPASDRVLRNSYVRFGRSSGRAPGSDEILNYLAAATAEAERKRAKHYVRYGRDGRHYVRFGRSFPGALAIDDEEAEADNAFAKRNAEKTYVRFGRSVDFDVSPAADTDSVVARRKRASGSGGKQYIRYGRNSALGENDNSRIARGGGQTQGASKHYVRFGRTSSGSAPDDANDFRLNLEEEEEEKRSGTGSVNKHYVRFGRTPEATGVAALDQETADKRSTHYVRFGRSGDLEQTVDENKVDIADGKRSPNYVRFG